MVVALCFGARAADAEQKPDEEVRESVLRPPNHPAVEITASAGALGRETAYGGRDAHWLLGGSVGWMPLRWLEFQALVDFSTFGTTRGENLTIRNTETFMGIGPAASLWVHSLRFWVEAAAGGLLSTVAYDGRDLNGGARFNAAAQLGAGFGVALFGKWGISTRFRGSVHEDRIATLFTLDLSWFGSKSGNSP